MMATLCRAEAMSISRALYQILAPPTVRTTKLQRQWQRPSPRTHIDIRSFSSTRPAQKTGRGAKRDLTPAKRTQKFDEEIKSRQIKLVEDGGGLSEPVNLNTLLASLDRKEQRIMQLSQTDMDVPICKVVTKKALYEAEKKKKEQVREQKKTGRMASSLKQLELNWAIDTGDMTHRLNKIKEFLSEGRRVEIILAAKKRGRAATPEECENLLARIREVTANVPGATVRKDLQGPRGGFASMMLQGKITETPDPSDE